MTEVDNFTQNDLFVSNGLLSESSFIPNGLLDDNSPRLQQEDPQDLERMYTAVGF